MQQCFNFDQISNLKNHDGIKKKVMATTLTNSITNSGMGRGAQGPSAAGAFSSSAISGFSTDRRPVKMRDFYGALRAAGGGMNTNQQATQHF